VKICLLDVDGVVADFLPHVLHWLHSDVLLEEITSWKFFDHLPECEADHARAILCRPEFWSSMPEVAGAREGVRELARGYEIVWVTSPWLPCPMWSDVRRVWLANHFNADPEDVIITSRKDVVRGDIYIDDSYDNVVGWSCRNQTHSQHGILFDAIHNRSDRYPIRLYGWERIKELMDMISDPADRHSRETGDFFRRSDVWGPT
jgi:5'(3')-deoxyribonucleotidase